MIHTLTIAIASHLSFVLITLQIGIIFASGIQFHYFATIIQICITYIGTFTRFFAPWHNGNASLLQPCISCNNQAKVGNEHAVF